jgi:hypothetical protein
MFLTTPEIPTQQAEHNNNKKKKISIKKYLEEKFSHVSFDMKTWISLCKPTSNLIFNLEHFKSIKLKSYYSENT